MIVRVTGFIIGLILAQGITVGIVSGLIAIIPIRGTELAMIVCPIAAVLVLSLSALAGLLAFGGKE